MHGRKSLANIICDFYYWINHIGFYLRTYLVILLLAAAGFLNAQSLSIKKYTSDDGLPQNSVYSIIQDSSGYIWFATEDGIARYNGINFEAFTVADGLVYTSVRVIHEDSRGNIWFGTERGLSKFDGTSFTNYLKTQWFTDDYIQSIAEDSSGTLWFATRAGGIARFEGDSIRTVNKELGLPDSIETFCHVNSDNSLWVATVGSGVYRYSGDSLSRYTREDGLISDSLTSINEDNSGNMWFGSLYGACVFEDNVFRNVYLDENKSSVSRINFILEDKEQNIWVGTDGKGLYFYDGDAITHYSEQTGLPSNMIYSCLEDLRGDLWFGTRNGGIFQVPVEKFTIYNERTGLAHNIVYSIYKDKSGKLWFGHEGDGITVFDEKNDKFTYYNTSNGLPSNSVPKIIGDEKGNIWISTFGRGVTKYDGKRFINYTSKDGLASDYVISMLEDSEGNIWFGCEGGISMYDPAYNKISTREDISSYTGSRFIYDIFEDYEGFLWFASATNGLLKFNKHKFIKAYTVEDGMPSDAVFSVTQDKLGNYWIGTESGGISKYDGEKFTNFSRKDGLPSNTCYFIVEHSNYLYIGSTQGITRFDFMAYDEKGQDAFKTYTRKDGLAATEMNSGSVFKDKNYNIFFGTQGGVTKFNPRNKSRDVASPIQLRNIRIIDNETVTDTLPESTLHLDYTQNNISFEFLGIDFVAPEKVLYKYKLEGVDAGWTESNEHSITYRSLPPNEYHFKVVCRNSDGIWSNRVLESSFVIHSPFWGTWWFYLFVFMGVSGLGYLFYRSKTRQVKRRNSELAQMVRTRTRELEEEKNKSDALLLNILPTSCVEELKENGVVKPREFKNVSILFTDFKEFSYTASVLPADSLVNELNEIFKEFDEIVSKYGLEKMKTIGDSYMAAGGLPKENKDHALITVHAALEMQNLINKRNETSPVKWEMRIGIHSGSVIAGVVGTKKFVYDIWGDTVNLASRMESSGDPGKVNISAYTYMLVKDNFNCEYRGKLDAKGKGKVDMYFVTGRKSGNKLSVNYMVDNLKK